MKLKNILQDNIQPKLLGAIDGPKNSKKQSYRVTLTLQVMSENENEASVQADEIVDALNDYYDCSAKVVDVESKTFGKVR